ncbi:EFC14 protein, partial [Oreotrochilus melanogaster]|nr:EFC14 protein [Oreotrochilus melanogaster]
ASDSESSSEEDEFAATGTRGRCGKGDYLRCCKFCYPLCAFVILAACVVACVGLVWMQVALKEDLDAIKEKFRTMESNQKTSFQEIPKLNEELVQKQKQLEQIETGDLGLNKVWINITEINKQISQLTSTVNHLKTNIKTSADLIGLPVTVEKLQKASTVDVAIAKTEVITLATKGLALRKISVYKFESWNNFLEACSWMFSVVSAENLELQSLSKLPCAGFIFQESQALRAALEELNNTVVVYQKLNDINLLNVDSAIGNLSRRVVLLENSPHAVNNLDKRENWSTSVVIEGVLFKNFFFLCMQEEAGTRDSQVSKLREKLQLMSALSSKPENDRVVETSKSDESSQSSTAKPTDLSRLASRSADDNTESSGQLRHLSLPGISSIEDLQHLFEKDEDADGKLSHEDLQRLLGSAAQESQSFRKFDTDGDEKYSLQELRLALGV